jgi:uncharacterized membrane protein YgcG
VTPPAMTSWSKVAMLTASHHDANTVFAAVDRHRLEDYKPYIYRTKDGGKTWRNVTDGIPDGHYLNSVKEDPVRKGLLFAGTEMGVFVSFDEGDHWQPLQMNLPNCSVRDLAIHDDDLIIATHGRSFWVMDDITPLREAGEKVAAQDAYLFKPRAAWRVRGGGDNGTPLPTDEAAAENPQLGASINYFLKAAPKNPAMIEILDATGKVIRKYASDDPAPRVNPATLDIPAFWVRPAAQLSAEPGMHRWMWDLHHTSRAPAGGGGGRGGGGGGGGGRGGGGAGPWALPGNYTVRLTVDGKSFTRPLAVKMDPHVKTPAADLTKQFDLSRRVADVQVEAAAASAEARDLRQQVTALRGAAKSMPGELTQALESLDKKLEGITGAAPPPLNPSSAGVAPPSTDFSSLRYVSGALGGVNGTAQASDVAPSLDALTAFQNALALLHKNEAQLAGVKAQDVPKVNALLRQAGLESIKVPAPSAGSSTGTPNAPAKKAPPAKKNT